MTRLSSRRAWLAAFVGLIALAWSAGTAAYPTRNIQIIVPFPAGGPTDTVARMVAEKLQQSFGKPVIVENRPGGGTLIGAEAVMRAEADGHTILCATVSTLAIAPTLYKQRKFNPTAALAPVILAVETPLVWAVSAKHTISTVAQLLAYAKSHPGELKFASVGRGTIPHLLGEMVKGAAGIDMQHVPYKGSAPALSDLAAGHVDVMFDQMGPVMALVQGGKLKALAIAAPKRNAAAPDLPTMQEVGYPLLARTIWTSFSVPAGTPAPVIQVLNAEIDKALQDPKVKGTLEKSSVFVVGGPPERLREVWHSDEAFWRDALTKANIELE